MDQLLGKPIPFWIEVNRYIDTMFNDEQEFLDFLESHKATMADMTAHRNLLISKMTRINRISQEVLDGYPTNKAKKPSV